MRIRTSSGLAQRSVYNVWSVVSALFRDASVAGLIDSNPCSDIGVRQLGPVVALAVTVEDDPTPCYDLGTASLSRVVTQEFRAGEGIRTLDVNLGNVNFGSHRRNFAHLKVQSGAARSMPVV
ncbi:MAG: hypothetical protein ABI704_08435 [Kofleriaceae bacterium]